MHLAEAEFEADLAAHVPAPGHDASFGIRIWIFHLIFGGNFHGRMSDDADCCLQARIAVRIGRPLTTVSLARMLAPRAFFREGQ